MKTINPTLGKGLDSSRNLPETLESAKIHHPFHKKGLILLPKLHVFWQCPLDAFKEKNKGGEKHVITRFDEGCSDFHQRFIDNYRIPCSELHAAININIIICNLCSYSKLKPVDTSGRWVVPSNWVVFKVFFKNHKGFVLWTATKDVEFFLGGSSVQILVSSLILSRLIQHSSPLKMTPREEPKNREKKNVDVSDVSWWIWEKTCIYLPQTNQNAPENKPKPKKKVTIIFQPPTFRGYVSFKGLYIYIYTTTT